MIKSLKVLHVTRDLIYGNSIYFIIYLNHIFWVNLSKWGVKKEGRKEGRRETTGKGRRKGGKEKAL